ncbi:hypothetical protein GCM10027449_26830 [Sinomonas notoginsengisoli]
MFDIKVETPLPQSILMTLGNLIDAAWPESMLALNEDPWKKQVIFRIDTARRTEVAPQDAAALRQDPDEDDLQVTGLGPDGATVITPQEIAAAFVPAVKAAFEEFPDAENYLEMPLRDPEDGHRYLLTFCRSAEQTPHELRMAAEQNLERAREDAHRDAVQAVQGLLRRPRGPRADTFQDGVRAALDALRQAGFGAGDPHGED